VHNAFKDEEEFLKMKNAIIDSMIMAVPQASRTTIRSEVVTYPRWKVETREEMTLVINDVQRFSKLKKKDAPFQPKK